MPPPLNVELLDHDPTWAGTAAAEVESLLGAIGPCLLTIDHIGSTAIPGLRARPIIDLLAAVTCLSALDDHRDRFAIVEYEWWGEQGLPERRYCTRSDVATGHRLFQLHCFEQRSPEIIRHLAFRDYLRKHPFIAAEYGREKERCRSQHADDSHAYGRCKSAWIGMIEAKALAWYRERSG